MVRESEVAQLVMVVPAQDLSERLNRTRERIALRAYELFEHRGRSEGRDVDDWLRAESELLHRFPHTVAETKDAFIVFANLPGLWKADELLIGVEPHRLIVSGERKTQVVYSDGKGNQVEDRLQSVLRVLDLQIDVDPLRTTARLANKTLEIVMPKARPAIQDSAKGR